MRRDVLRLPMGSAGALVLSAAARTLTAPAAMGSRFYVWLFQFR